MEGKVKSNIGKVNRTNYMSIALILIIVLIYLINQALGYGNIAVAQESENIKTTYLSSCLTGIGTSLELVALLKLINRPVQSILFTLLSQIVLVFSDLSQGYSFSESFSNSGVIEIYFSLMAIGMLVMLWKKYSKQSKKKNEALALSKYIKFKREPLRVPMWAVFSIICLGLSLVVASANKLEVGLWSDSIPFRVYVGLTLFVPTLTTLAMYTASTLVYYLYGSMMALKLVAIARLATRGEARWTLIIISLIQLLVFMYCLISYLTFRKVKSSNVDKQV